RLRGGGGQPRGVDAGGDVVGVRPGGRPGVEREVRAPRAGSGGQGEREHYELGTETHPGDSRAATRFGVISPRREQATPSQPPRRGSRRPKTSSRASRYRRRLPDPFVSDATNQ